MALIVPPAKNYTSPLIVRPEKWMNTPPEGPLQIPMTINWGTDASTGGSVACNLNVNPPSTFSQIAALTVDNSQSGADVTFVFPDTQQSYVVPAYQCVPAMPVFTSGTNFYVIAPSALSSDVTTFSVHNTMPPVLDLPKSEFQSVGAVVGIGLATSTTTLVAAGTNGTLSVLNVNLTYNGAATGSGHLTIEDGNNNGLWVGTFGATGAANYAADLVSLADMNVRFSNGLKLAISGVSGSPSGAVNVNVYYRTP